MMTLAFTWSTGNALAQTAKIDSLRKTVKFARDDSNSIKALNSLAWEYRSFDPDSSIILSKRALEISKALDWDKGLADSYRCLGTFYMRRGEYAQAMEYFEQSLHLYALLNDAAGTASVTGNMGTVFWSQGNYPRALECYFSALKIFEEQQDSVKMALALGNIGNIYADQEDFTSSLDYYGRALKLYEALSDTAGIAMTLGNLGNIFTETESYDKALNYFIKSLKLSDRIGDRQLVSYNLDRIGVVYQKEKKYTESKRYYIESLVIARELDDRQHVAILLGNLGALCTEMGSYRDAERYLDSSLVMAVSINSLDDQRIAHDHLSRLYEITGDHKLALEHFKRFVAVRDSITNEENIKKQTRAEMNYEFEKKEASAMAEQEKKDAVTRIIIYSISGGLLLVLVLAGYIFYSYRQKQKANMIITKQKLEVERQKHLVEEKQKEILDSIRYAKRIQLSLLPAEKMIERQLRAARS